MEQALGIVETGGIIALVQAADAMLKAADVHFTGWKQIGSDCYALFISGDTGAVKAAVAAGASAAKKLGEDITAVHVIPQPHDALRTILQTCGIIERTRDSLAESARMHAEQQSCGVGKVIPAGETGHQGAAQDSDRLFNSSAANAIKEEICAVGRKLWLRSYVDGNGGNISYRIGENAVICTPTLLSKADLKPEDLCLVDLEGRQLAGTLPRTSEVYLHLEIFKAVAAAKAVVHCHPPHATAYAITGHVPPSTIIPEFDVFVGSVAITQYETPGTKKFAETVLPYVQSHNTVLLGNHGIVCWADTPTHAEWYAENLETYCWTLLISRQLGIPYTRIPPEKEQELLKIKKRLGLPDARFDRKEGEVEHAPESPGAIAIVPPAAQRRNKPSLQTLSDADIEAVAKAAADAIMAATKRK
jgi:L-fuculose-phosphate aldolase